MKKLWWILPLGWLLWTYNPDFLFSLVFVGGAVGLFAAYALRGSDEHGGGFH